ncbi:MAG: ABC transporter substrate-binding protein, partial [Longimicrobiales bacterium]
MKTQHPSLGTKLANRAGISLSALGLALFLVVPAASGQQTATDPMLIVKERNESVKKMLDAAGDPVSDETREELKGAINSLIDFEELSRRALRKHWEPLTAEEQADFVDVFRELVRNSSVQKLGIYRADRITYE